VDIHADIASLVRCLHGPFGLACSVPQGTVLGLVNYIAYTEDVVRYLVSI